MGGFEGEFREYQESLRQFRVNAVTFVIWGNIDVPETGQQVDDLDLFVSKRRPITDFFTDASAPPQSSHSAFQVTVPLKGEGLESINDAHRRVTLLFTSLVASNESRAGLGVRSLWLDAKLDVAETMAADSMENARLIRIALSMLDDVVAAKIENTLIWLSQGGMISSSDTFGIHRQYLYFFLAFENLVAAALDRWPMERAKNCELLTELRQASTDTQNAVKLITELYQRISPTLRERTNHSFNRLFPEKSGAYMKCMFEKTEFRPSLANMRNMLAHGSTRIDSVKVTLQIKDAMSELWTIVYDMLAQFVPVRVPFLIIKSERLAGSEKGEKGDIVII